MGTIEQIENPSLTAACSGIIEDATLVHGPADGLAISAKLSIDEVWFSSASRAALYMRAGRDFYFVGWRASDGSVQVQ